jgi:hypothetical protein
MFMSARKARLVATCRKLLSIAAEQNALVKEDPSAPTEGPSHGRYHALEAQCSRLVEELDRDEAQAAKEELRAPVPSARAQWLEGAAYVMALVDKCVMERRAALRPLKILLGSIAAVASLFAIYYAISRLVDLLGPGPVFESIFVATLAAIAATIVYLVVKAAPGTLRALGVVALIFAIIVGTAGLVGVLGRPAATPSRAAIASATPFRTVSNATPEEQRAFVECAQAPRDKPMPAGCNRPSLVAAPPTIPPSTLAGSTVLTPEERKFFEPSAPLPAAPTSDTALVTRPDPMTEGTCAGLTSAQCIVKLYPPGPPPPPQPTDGSMRFEMADTGSDPADWISAQGTIDINTPSYFEAFLGYWGPGIAKNYPEGFTVRLNSPGGDLGAGLELGKLIRQHHLSTEVGATRIPPNAMLEVSIRQPGTCNSACAYAFLGGEKRTASGGSLGFHQFGDNPKVAVADRTSQAQAATGILIRYLKRMGIDPEVLALASAMPGNRIDTPDEATMARLRITTDYRGYRN